MSQELEISCPKCSIVFTVPVELCGELAECSECTSVFEIPFPEEKAKKQDTDTGAIKGVAARTEDVDTTHTVKLSRTGIGMIPTLKETFEFGTKAPPQMAPNIQSNQRSPKQQIPPPQTTIRQQEVAAPPPPAQSPTQSKTTFKKPAFRKPPVPGAPPPQQEIPTQIPIPQATEQLFTETNIPTDSIQRKEVDIPAWINIRLSKEEEPLACSVTKNIPIGTLFLIALPPLLCAPLPFIGNNLVALIIAIVIALITFTVAFVIASASAKKAVILTTHRAICVFGKKSYETKK